MPTFIVKLSTSRLQSGDICRWRCRLRRENLFKEAQHLELRRLPLKDVYGNKLQTKDKLVKVA